MKSYVFRVDLEPDKEGWRAFYTPLEHLGASTWAETREEAIKNIQDVLSLILEELEEEGQPVPDTERMMVSEGAVVAVTR